MTDWFESCGTHSFRAECPQLGTPPPAPITGSERGRKALWVFSTEVSFSYPKPSGKSLALKAPAVSPLTHWVKVLMEAFLLLQADMGERTRPSPHPGPGGKRMTGVSGAVSQAWLPPFPRVKPQTQTAQLTCGFSQEMSGHEPGTLTTDALIHTS